MRTRLLIVNPQASGVTDALVEQVRAALPGPLEVVHTEGHHRDAGFHACLISEQVVDQVARAGHEIVGQITVVIVWICIGQDVGL